MDSTDSYDYDDYYGTSYTGNYYTDYIEEFLDFIDWVKLLLSSLIFIYIESLLSCGIFPGRKRWVDHPCFLGIG